MYQFQVFQKRSWKIRDSKILVGVIDRNQVEIIFFFIIVCQFVRIFFLLNNKFFLQYQWGYSRFESMNVKESLLVDRIYCSLLFLEKQFQDYLRDKTNNINGIRYVLV